MRIAIAAAIHGYFLHRASRNEGVSKTAMPMPTMRPTHTLRSAHCTVYNSPVRRTGRSQMAEIVLFHSALGLRPGYVPPQIGFAQRGTPSTRRTYSTAGFSTEWTKGCVPRRARHPGTDPPVGRSHA